MGHFNNEESIPTMATITKKTNLNELVVYQTIRISISRTISKTKFLEKHGDGLTEEGKEHLWARYVEELGVDYRGEKELEPVDDDDAYGNYEIDDYDLPDVDDLMDEVKDMKLVVEEEEEEEEEIWENIYYEGPFVGFCGEHPHLQDFKPATYYQTFGGGPEGGYLVMPDGEVYTTQRMWGTPFDLPRKLEGKKLLRKKMDGNWMCRLVGPSV